MGLNIRISVTQTDILKGRKGSPQRCPIARACKRAGLRKPNVNDDCVEFEGARGYRTLKLPLKAEKFITNFDTRKSNVSPISFTLTT